MLIEPNEERATDAETTVLAIEKLFDDSGFSIPRLLHGKNATTWEMIHIALARSYDTRIGFEDTLYLPDGSIAKDNGQLVRRAREMCTGNN